MKLQPPYRTTEFQQYLIVDCGIKESSAKSYLSYINSAQERTKMLDVEHSNNKSIYIQTIIDLLAADSAQIRYGVSQKSISNWKSGLNAYIQFLNELNEESTQFEQSTPDEPSLFIPDINQTYSYSNKDLRANFTNRIITQDRLYPPIYFQISLIKRLFFKRSEATRKYFENWLCDTLDEVMFVSCNNEPRSLKDITTLTIRFEDQTPINEITVNGKKETLYTHTADGKKIKMEKSKLSDIALDHVDPISLVLTQKQDELAGLRILTEKISRHIDTKMLRNSARKAANDCLKELIANDALIDLLKRDLEIIKDHTKLELMCRIENFKKSNN